MTTTEAEPLTETDDWKILKLRFPKAKDTILFAYFVLQSNPDIELDDLKAQAKLHDIRVPRGGPKAAAQSPWILSLVAA